jgi:magnesium transporter
MCTAGRIAMPVSSTQIEVDEAPDVIREVIVEEQPGTARKRTGEAARIRAWRFRRDDPVPDEIDVDRLAAEISDGSDLIWIDLSAYRDDDLRALGKTLDLNPAGIRLALAAWRRPGLDAFENHALASVTVVDPNPETRKVGVDELDLFVAEQFVLSAHVRPLPFEEQVLSRAGGNAEQLKQDAPFLLYIILDELVEHYERVTEHLEEEIERMEERALGDSSDTFLSDLVRLKRYVFTITRLADQHRAVFSGLLRPDFPFISSEHGEDYFRDLEGRFSGRMDTLMAARDGVNGSFDIYVSSVAHRTNHVIKLLTIVSALLLPASMVFGFFGINFTQMAIFEPWGFYVMLGIVALMVGGMLGLFWRRGWF